MLSTHDPAPVALPPRASTVIPAGVVGPAPPWLNLRTILVPTDFSPASNRALVYARRLAWAFGASLRVLNVVEPMDPPHGLLLARLLLENAATTRAHSRREMAIFADVVLSSDGPRADFDFRTGRAGEEIVRAARELACDLIVLAAHGHSRLTRWLLGSTAERVVRLAPCPVLVVREPGS